MKKIKQPANILFKIAICMTMLIFTSAAYASCFIPCPFYISLKTGILQANFTAKFTDKTDLFSQNITESIEQHGYVAGIAVGYDNILNDNYLLGAEFSATLDSRSASFQSGAASTSFSNQIEVRHHFDLSFIPGILVADNLFAYLRLGLSYAHLADHVNSPVGFSPTRTTFNSDAHAWGILLGIGATKFLNKQLALFAEATYRDYGSLDFADFQNFSASYSHSAHVYVCDTNVGIAYHFA